MPFHWRECLKLHLVRALACFTQEEQEILGFSCHKDYLDSVVDGETYYLYGKGNYLTIGHNEDETCIKQTNGIDDVDRVKYVKSLIWKMISDKVQI